MLNCQFLHDFWWLKYHVPTQLLEFSPQLTEFGSGSGRHEIRRSDSQCQQWSVSRSAESDSQKNNEQVTKHLIRWGHLRVMFIGAASGVQVSCFSLLWGWDCKQMATLRPGRCLWPHLSIISSDLTRGVYTVVTPHPRRRQCRQSHNYL